MRRTIQVFLVFLALGLTSFGGPVAHLGYFREAFVVRRRWLSEADYADLVALCQFIPGPASSQVGIAIGWQRAGWAGAFAAWLAFTAPSVVLLYLFALGADFWSGAMAQGVLHGLKIAALAVVAQAVWQMAERLTPDWPRRGLALAAAMIVLLVPWAPTPVIVIAAAALGGSLIGPAPAALQPTARPVPAWASALLATFLTLLIGLPILAVLTNDPAIELVDRFYRTGSLVFGGGHVVLPLLQNELVATGQVDAALFLAGYGAAQAVPGPLFSFAFYAGAMLSTPPNGVAGGLLALAAIYLPSFLLVLGGLPWWERLKTIPRLRRGLDTANAAVVGLLLAALVNPVFPAAVRGPLDLVVGMAALAALFLKLPPILVVIACGALGAALPG